jgi:protein-disulfide isomerase
VLLTLLAPAAACRPDEPAPAAESLPPSVEMAAPAGERRPTLVIGHPLGAEDAPLTVVEFSDFGCPACADFARETLPVIQRDFVETGRVRWRYVPIRQGFYRGGEAASAAVCAAEQDRFREMHDLLLHRQREWQTRGDPARIFTAYAEEAGGDPAAFAACYASDRPEASLRLNDLVALNMGIRGIPVFLIGDQRVIGALSPERFARVLDDQLEARRREAATP